MIPLPGGALAHFRQAHPSLRRSWEADDIASEGTSSENDDDNDSGDSSTIPEGVPPIYVDPSHRSWLLCGDTLADYLEYLARSPVSSKPSAASSSSSSSLSSSLAARVPLESLTWTIQSAPCSHQCNAVCHSACSPCQRPTQSQCRCGQETRFGPCCDSIFTCTTICNAMADCGRHRCRKLCCDGNHEECPRKGEQGVRCGCGKQLFAELPCDAPTPSCGGTCGRLLECGKHTCNQRCGHPGNCGPCPERKRMVCQCGETTSLRPCSETTPFTCQKVCGRQLSCNRPGHVCKKKCCGGKKCRPCRRVCGQMLTCGRHRCKKYCHDGPCTPCRETESISCACGQSVIVVACGDAESTKPPVCLQKCTKKPICHHTVAAPHTCHFGPCPKCKLPCGKRIKACGHNCSAPCHLHTPCPPC